MNPLKKTFAALIVGGASAAAVLVGNNFVKNVQFARAAEEVEVTRQQLATVTDLSNVFKAVGKAVEPSVVNIQVRKQVRGGGQRSLPFDEDTLRRFFPDRDGNGQPDLPPGMNPDGSMEQIGTGSGVIMEVDKGVAYIVTNNHVAGGATELDITLHDGREIKNGKVIGTDTKTDLAVIKVEAERVIPAKWGNSDQLERGDWVLAFGSPFGYVGSMTHGIVSALNREAQIIPQGYENFIQVDAPINPGNSGGPLVNLRGEVIGINTAIASRSGGFQGIGFAIPSNQAQYVYNQLKGNGKVTRGWLGVSIQDVAKAAEDAENLGYKGKDGVLVRETMRETPAFGKLKAGDVITKIDGKAVGTVQQLRNQVAMTTPGKEVTLTVFRDGKDEEIKLTIGEQPDDLVGFRGGRGERLNPGNDVEATVESLGIRLSNPTDELLQKHNLSDVKDGAMITAVSPRSLAATAGLRVGDLITRVGNTQVANADEAREAIRKGDLTKGIRLFVANAEGSRFVVLRKADGR